MTIARPPPAPERPGRRTRRFLLVAFPALVLLAACGGTWCPPENRCGARCVDLDTDAHHCGTCGVRCVHPAECREGVCESPCPPSYHDGGDGSCVPRGRCADGFHDGGDGVCVPEGSCRPGYRDGGDGTCWPHGACADGHRLGGDGSCQPDGECSPGYRPDRHGRCRVPGPCADGVQLEPGPLDFGRTRPGDPRRRLLWITPAAGADRCEGIAIRVADGTASAFALDPATPPPASLDAGSAVALWVDYRPEHFGRHGGRLLISVDDPHAPDRSIVLDGAAVASPVEAEDDVLDLGRVQATEERARWTCVRNDGDSDLALVAMDMESDLFGAFALEHVPSAGAALPPNGGRLCVRVAFRPRRTGPHGSALVVTVDDGLPPMVVQIVAEAE